MNEEFLQFIWQQKLFEHSVLHATSNGEQVEIIDVGEKNTDSGPDFFNAKIKSGTTVWAGNVEIHVYSSDWEKHKHHLDKAYNNVILQVVHKNDKKVFNAHGKLVPTIEIRYNKKLLRKYQQIVTNRNWIPCEQEIQEVDPYTIRFYSQSLLVERLEKKAEAIQSVLYSNKNNWDETFYQMLSRNYGFNLNSYPFERLAKSLPCKIISKHKDDRVSVESLLFGQAGFLDDEIGSDYYHEELRNRYHHMQRAYSLESIDNHLWKFLRSRPSNFPTIRIAQLAALLSENEHIFSRVLEIDDLKGYKAMFRKETYPYWDTRYIFGKITHEKKKVIGPSSINLLIMNTIVPFLFVYGMKKNDNKYKERAFQLLEQIPPEKNKIIMNWQKLGMEINDAFHSQAFIQLKRLYCEKKNCLRCKIGNEIIRKN